MKKIMNRIRSLAKDEGGMEALQTVCIVAIAATIMIAIAIYGGKGTKMMENNFNKLQQTSTVKSNDGVKSPEYVPPSADELKTLLR